MNKTKFEPQKDGRLLERTVEFFHHAADPAWGCAEPRQDTFALIHPRTDDGTPKPLCVVFHSAGHDVYSCVGCTWLKGNHDIYHTPPETFALYVDCRAHADSGDWWWGGINARGEGDSARRGTALQPVEKRIIATVEWVIKHYCVDPERVYALGNSMGGSGALGIALRRGDLFAAIKVNVPAGVRHAADRCCLDTPAPEGFRIPDPPVVVDYSAQDDMWSDGHEVLYRGMCEKKYALFGYWGAFGHANNNEVIEAENDLVHSFDIYSVTRSAPYPVFTRATTDGEIPWPDHRDSKVAGQVNAFFRWKNVAEGASSAVMELRLLTAGEWKTRVPLPTVSTADVTLRRLSRFRIAPGEKLLWRFGAFSGTVFADASGLATIPHLAVTAVPERLELRRQ